MWNTSLYYLGINAGPGHGPASEGLRPLLGRFGNFHFGREGSMAAQGTPYFHNQPGVAKIRIGAKEFMCIGALPPFDHPHIFIDMGGDNEAVCPYCSTHYVYDADLHGECEPAECLYTPATGPEPRAVSEPALP